MTADHDLERRLAAYVAELRRRVDELGSRGAVAVALTVRGIAEELEQLLGGRADGTPEPDDRSGLDAIRNLLVADGASEAQLEVFDAGMRDAEHMARAR